MVSDHAVSRLTTAQRTMLVDHIDGPVQVVAARLTGIRHSLIRSKLLKGHPVGVKRPRETVLTEIGRMAVGMILGDYADALVRAGLFEQENPLAVLRRLQAARRGQLPAEFAPIAPEPAVSGAKSPTQTDA